MQYQAKSLLLSEGNAEPHPIFNETKIERILQNKTP